MLLWTCTGGAGLADGCLGDVLLPCTENLLLPSLHRAPRLSRPYQVAPGQLMGRQQRAREGGKVVLCVARKMYFVLLKLALHFFQAKYMKILLK